MSEREQIRLSPEILAVMRGGASAALVHGARFVAPSHLLLGLLADARVGRQIAPLLPGERIVRAATREAKPPPASPQPETPFAGDEPAPFPRYDSLAFRSLDGSRTLYLDADSHHLFFEGARRADDVYRPKHLIYGFIAEAVKNRDLLELFGADPAAVMKAVDEEP